MTDTSPPAEDTRRTGCIDRAARFTGWAAAVAAVGAGVALIIFYRLISDGTVAGEAVTVFPPVLWVIPLGLLATLSLLSRSWKAPVASLLACLVFLVATEDWRPLLRAGMDGDKPPGHMRVITWNIAGRSDWVPLLQELAELEPDVVFLQETPDGENSLSSSSLTGYWDGFSWWDQGDCGILSRYELGPLESRKIGPWDKPALAAATLPAADSTTVGVLLCSVRMMLPSAAISPDRWMSNYPDRVREHRLRIQQYPALAALISEKMELESTDRVIFGGDFNVRGNSHSLGSLENAGYHDAWYQAGAGWGATFMTEFPMARIDQIWLSEGLTASHARTEVGRTSDHRMLLTDVVIR